MSDDTPTKPAPKKPAAKKPAAKKPAAKKPAAKKPSTSELPDTQPTEVTTSTRPLPVQGDAAPTDVVERVAASEPATEPAPEPTVVVVEAPKKKRRRWTWVLGGILLVLAILLTIAFFVGEAYAKNYARDTIKERIVAVLGIDDPSTVTVDIGDGSVLFQALAGRLNTVDVTASAVTFGTLSGAATVHAEGVPLDADAATEQLDVTFAVPEDQVVSALSGALSGLQLESVTLEEPEIVIATTLDLFIFQLPVAMGLEPSADEGKIVFTPTTITLNDQDFTADELRDELGDLAGGLLSQQAVCVNESLPVALTIVDVDVVKKDLVLKINGDGVALGGSDLSTPGTCAG